MPKGVYPRKKAVTGNLNPFSAMQMITGMVDSPKYTAKDLLRFNKAWVYIANNKNANSIATIPLKLFYQNKTSKKIKMYNTIPVKQPLLKCLPVTKQFEVVEIEDHPFLDLMSNINTKMNYIDFQVIVQTYLGLVGNSFVEIIKEGSKIVQLNPLYSEWISIVTDKSGVVTSYQYDDGTNKKSYPVDSIVHFANYQAGNMLYGVGELEACIAAAERYNYYDRFETALNRNYARPDFAVIYKGRYSNKELKEAYAQWYKAFGGENKGKPIIAAGEIDVKELGFAPKDMSFKEGRLAARSEILGAFGIPESVIQYDANRATSQVGLEQYFRLTLEPKLRKFCEKLNEQLIPTYESDGLFVWYDPNYFRLENSLDMQTMEMAFKDGVLTRDEMREYLGFEPGSKDKEGGDKNEESV